MKAYNPNSPLISIHVPKCAGTSFFNILESWYNKHLYTHYFNEKWNIAPKKHALYKGILRKSIKPGICIHGHFNNAREIGVSDYYPEIDQFITILRDPFDLHLSNYFYIKNLGKHKNVYRAKKTIQILAENWSLEEYLEKNDKSLIPLFMPKEITLDNYEQVLDQKFIAIGISERLQDSVNLLAEQLDFPAIQVAQVNQSEWDEPIPAGAREMFMEKNQLAMRIYTFAKNQLSEELKSKTNGSAKTNGSVSGTS